MDNIYGGGKGKGIGKGGARRYKKMSRDYAGISKPVSVGVASVFMSR